MNSFLQTTYNSNRWSTYLSQPVRTFVENATITEMAQRRQIVFFTVRKYEFSAVCAGQITNCSILWTLRMWNWFMSAVLAARGMQWHRHGGEGHTRTTASSPQPCAASVIDQHTWWNIIILGVCGAASSCLWWACY